MEEKDGEKSNIEADGLDQGGGGGREREINKGRKIEKKGEGERER